MTTVSDFLRSRGIVAADIVGSVGHGELRLAGADGESVALTLDSLDEADRYALMRHRLAFADAKDDLKRLLQAGVDIRRPLCAKTIARLDGHDAQPHNDVKLRLSRLLDAAEDLDQRVVLLENRLLPVIAALEVNGLPIDVEAWKTNLTSVQNDLQKERVALGEHLGDVVGRDLFGQIAIDLDHPEEIRRALGKLLGAPPERVTNSWLRGLDHPVGTVLLRYREAKKIVSTYGASFLEHVDDSTGRLHPSFDPLGTSTGRLSCAAPNLQNLPGDERWHRAIRPADGRVLITADYGAAELRILAELADESGFIDAFVDGTDLHSAVATRLFAKKVSKQENPELRHRAKAINFGLIYGMGPAALADDLGLHVDEARDLLTAYFRAFPRVRDFLHHAESSAERNGEVRTIIGRTLRLDFDNADDDKKAFYRRIARNMPIQGTSADMMKLALIHTHRALGELSDAMLVNTVHDEIVVEASATDAERARDLLIAAMTRAHQQLIKRVPVEVDVTVDTWWNHG